MFIGRAARRRFPEVGTAAARTTTLQRAGAHTPLPPCRSLSFPGPPLRPVDRSRRDVTRDSLRLGLFIASVVYRGYVYCSVSVCSLTCVLFRARVLFICTSHIGLVRFY